MPRPRPQAAPPLAPTRMLRLMTLAAMLTVGALAAALWQVQRQPGFDQIPPGPGGAAHAIPPEERPPDEGFGLFMGEDSRREMASAVATVVGMGPPGGAAPLGVAALVRADRNDLFLATHDSDRVPKLRPDLLAHVRDGERVNSFWGNEDEAAAYCDALIKADRTPAEVFARNARRDIGYVNVFEQPRRYRGEVVSVRGRLRMLTRYDPPLMAVQAGVRDLYEGWVADERYPTNLWCVVFTELPPGITPGERIDYPVAIDGYFFKRYRYKSLDSIKANQFRDAPLLIGRTLRLEGVAVPVTASGDWSGYLLPGFMVLLTVSVALTVGLTWWYRRDDRNVRRRLMNLRRPEFVEPGTQAGAGE